MRRTSADRSVKVKVGLDKTYSPGQRRRYTMPVKVLQSMDSAMLVPPLQLVDNNHTCTDRGSALRGSDAT